jgi:YVTN family beta-propeller protein
MARWAPSIGWFAVVATVLSTQDPASVALTYQCVYVADDRGTVDAIDTNTNTLTANIPVQGYPHNLAVTPDGRFVYAARFGGVTLIDTTTNRVTTTISLGGVANVASIAFRPDGAFAYATYRILLGVASNVVRTAVIDTNTRAVVTTLPQASHVVISPDRTEGYAIEESDLLGGSDSLGLLVFDTSTNAVVATIPNVNGINLAIAPDGQFLYVTGSDGTLTVVDTVTRTVSNTFQVGGVSDSIAITPDGHFAYLALYGAELVSVFSVPPGEFIENIPLDGLPHRIAISPIGFAYVTTLPDSGFPSPGITVIDVATNHVTAAIPLKGAGSGIAIASVPNGCDAPVCEGDCDGDGDVTVDELLTAVNINLRNGPFGACPAFDTGSNGHVPIDALLRAVNNALSGCPTPRVATPSSAKMRHGQLL